LRINPCDFFKKLAEEIDYDAFLHKDLPDNNDFSEEFAQKWKDLDKNAQKYLYNFINNSENKLKFYELNILEQILSKIPKNTNVHLANSMSVRYANYWANHPNIQNNLKIYSNRGTSGIDGCTSTALGFALADENMLNVLVTGDLAFFYDRNAFFRKEIPKNLCVIVLNNQGGNIFRFVEGANQQPELEEFFETPHHFTAENTAKDANLDYFCAKNNTELEKSLTQVFLENAKNGLKNACILEIFTNKKENTDIFLAMKNGFS
jgi:2-succinyl-5-enolpyruvyl-6-hydroxy-3-cyclohexene-1-carboxylate synthase